MVNTTAKASSNDTITRTTRAKRSGSGSSKTKRSDDGGFQQGRAIRDRSSKRDSGRVLAKAQSESASGTVTVQARVDADFATELLQNDASVLGLSGMSEVVREGLRLLHRRARELALASEYERFYGGQPAPLPDGVVPPEVV
jgi:hypothetical protein